MIKLQTALKGQKEYNILLNGEKVGRVSGYSYGWTIKDNNGNKVVGICANSRKDAVEQYVKMIGGAQKC